MFRCMKNLEVSQSNATTEIQDTEQSVLAQDYPNLVQALQSSQIIRAKSTSPSTVEQPSWEKGKETFRNTDFTKLYDEYMQYANSHLAIGWT
ncbi:hypothetical protein XU18_2340 [Perkinsela sp. CCAP 1560/4]|nr:hypothetical protein XU18_2340 [Perkinsela sp. CCAP 1560/4]|eukprot:KNH06909.1 hypothetical protein XU18_2340 [Perkinsela sp. CCAP 1560/4]